MSGIDTLLDKLRNQQTPGTPQEHWQEKKREWIEDLESLRGTVSAWLQRGVNEGLLELRPRTVELNEVDLGTYDAPALDIHVHASGTRVVKMEPRSMRVVGVVPAPGLRIVGAVGRVDLSCGPARAMLLRRKRGQWQFVAVDREFSSGDAVLDLTEDSLAAVLAELIE